MMNEKVEYLNKDFFGYGFLAIFLSKKESESGPFLFSAITYLQKGEKKISLFFPEEKKSTLFLLS